MQRPTVIVHRFLGIIVGVFIIVISLTGSILVFDKEVNPILHLHTHQVVPQGEQISLQQVAAIIHQQYPEQKLEHITIPQTANDPYHVLIKSLYTGKSDIYINTYTGKLLGIYKRDRPIIRIVNQLHTHLLAGKIGGFIVGLCGVLLLILSITGLMLWNGWKKFSIGFKIRWQAKWRMLQYDIHKVVGVLSAIFLVFIATSGSIMVFDKPIKNLAYGMTGQTKIAPPISTLSTNNSQLTLDQFLQTAKHYLPAGQPTILHIPKDETAPIRIRFRLPHEIIPEGKSFVFLNQYTGEILRVENFYKTPRVEQLKSWMDVLHKGSYGGLGTMGLYILIGITSSALSITGFVIWWGRNHKTKPQRHSA
ncbi:PepSY-associated TM helix domain-containing protein [Anabaena sp. CCY 9910]|uniref:PepSY-associated TM helix domain-containing protein n=1 Tax=Anabaena sp. CCY 9910 TaxID=3103870 RepID=UPI0039E00123